MRKKQKAGLKINGTHIIQGSHRVRLLVALYHHHHERWSPTHPPNPPTASSLSLPDGKINLACGNERVCWQIRL
jgi:hypothetical protein